MDPAALTVAAWILVACAVAAAVGAWAAVLADCAVTVFARPPDPHPRPPRPPRYPITSARRAPTPGEPPLWTR